MEKVTGPRLQMDTILNQLLCYSGKILYRACDILKLNSL